MVPFKATGVPEAEEVDLGKFEPSGPENPGFRGNFPVLQKCRNPDRWGSYRWQALQLSPLSKCLSVAAWQERQFIAGLCQAGFTGARSWPGVERWQTAHPVFEATGTWQLTQWPFRGAFQPAVWEEGAVDAWQRLQESLAWQVAHRVRSMAAAIPWAFWLQKAV